MQIDKTLFGCRFAYNCLLFSHEKAFEIAGICPGYFELSKELPALKEKFPILKEADATALQGAAKNLSRAYNYCAIEFTHHNEFAAPHHKREDTYRQSYRTTNRNNCIALIGDCVKIPKTGLVKIHLSQPFSGRILSATITREGSDKYFISFCIEMAEPPLPLPKTGKAVGIDLGLHTFAVTFDGEKIERFEIEDFYEKYNDKLNPLYEKLLQQTKGSKSWRKTYNQLNKLRLDIANQRKDALNKISTDLVRRYDIIVIEDLHVQSLMEQKNKSRAIQNAAWGEFRKMLEYKAEKYGRKLITVNQYFPSSQICSDCGYRWPRLKDSRIRTWTCPVCGKSHDRDENAAINILRKGLESLTSAA